MAKDGRKPYAECGVCGRFTKTNNDIGVCEECAKDYDETGRFIGTPSVGGMFEKESDPLVNLYLLDGSEER